MQIRLGKRGDAVADAATRIYGDCYWFIWKLPSICQSFKICQTLLIVCECEISGEADSARIGPKSAAP